MRAQQMKLNKNLCEKELCLFISKKTNKNKKVRTF